MRREIGKRTVQSLLVGLFSTVLALSADAEEATSFKEAMKEGETNLSFRYRFETVDQDPLTKEAYASTLRTTLNYRTGVFRGFSLFLEAENVAAVIDDDSYANAGAGSLNNGVTGRPVVADPEITEINQAYLRYTSGKTTLTAGRQALNIGDQRFVGTVGWRQNHQSFDALTVSTGRIPKTALSYSFVDNTNRIFGDNKAMASHLLNAAVDLPVGKLRLYGFLLDYDRLTDAGLSTRTFGAEISGATAMSTSPLGVSKFLWELELAQQADAGDNPRDVDVGYLHAMVGGVFPAVTIKAGYEVLEGNPADGRFLTPLATLHKFNGWADKFLVTPPNGIEDLYLSISGQAKKIKWLAVYHDFEAESSGTSYGSEVDLQATYKTAWGQTFGLKGAFYEADDFSSDTNKLWFWTAWSF